MKKMITMVTIFSMIAVALIGRGSSGLSNGAGADSPQTVSTDGSTSMEKVIGFLSEAYTQEHGDIKVTYNPTGSSSGIRAAAEGRCDMGLSSRDLKEEEAADLQGTVIALDGIGIIVHPDNPVADLTMEQIGDHAENIAEWVIYSITGEHQKGLYQRIE